MTRYAAKHPSRMEPAHPGELLREELLPELGFTVSEAARRLGVSRQAVHAILSERAAISPEMAVRLGKLCGNGPHLWLSMQVSHDLWHAERKLAREVARIRSPRHPSAA